MHALTIANPLFLWLLPLAGLPILFHLFFRIRKRTRPFSTLMFFDRADPRLNARRRIREWLALLLRALLIAFLLLALARPLWVGRGGGANAAVALIVDNSGSMSGAGRGGRSKLAAAREAADAMVGALSPGDSAAIVLLVDDYRATLPRGLTSDRAALRSALELIAETEASGAPGRALAEAFALLESGSQPLREVHIFTDLQEAEWSRSLLTTRMPPADTSFTVHRIASEPAEKANVSVVEASAPSSRLLAGRRFAAKIGLTNPGRRDAQVRLNAVSDDGIRSSRDVAVPARETRTVNISVLAASSGLHWLEAWVENDAFLPDNRAYLGFPCGEKERVVFLGGEGQFGTLPIGLSPSADGALSGLVPVFASAERLSLKLTEDRPLMAVATWDGLTGPGDGGPLKRFVEAGGVLLVVPPLEDVAPSGSTAPWIGAALKEQVRSKEGFQPLVFDKENALWQDVRDEKGDVRIRNVRVYRAWTLSQSPGAVPLMGLEDGRVVMSVIAVGQGRVLACGFAFDPAWSTLPLRGVFLPIVQTMALFKPASLAGVASLAAGDRISAPAGQSGPVHIWSLAGGPMDWRGPADRLPVFPKSGLYAGEFKNGLRYAAVRGSELEGQARFVDADAVPALAAFPHRVAPYRDPQSLVNDLKRQRTGLDMYVPLLLLGLLALLAEGWMVNPHLRRAPETPGPSRAASSPAGAQGLSAAGALVWHPHVSPVAAALIFALFAVWIYLLRRRMLTRMSPHRALVLLLPKIAVLVLLLLALFDPAWSMAQRKGAEGRILALVDDSSSMDVKDDNVLPRLTRARRLLGILKDRLRSQASVTAVEFDTALRETAAKRPPSKGDEILGTDLAGCLLALSERADLSSYSALVVLTDGGDEPVEGAALPAIPMYVVGVGTDPARWNDLAISEVQFPASVEKDTDFEISADLAARTGGGGDFARNLSRVRVSLERKNGSSWERVAENSVDLSNRRVRIRFRTSCKTPGLEAFRLSVPPVAGELSALNNERTFALDVRKKAVHVLFFTREVGSDLKMIRSELAADPGVTFTALFRTIGERFTVQGERLPGDEELDAGFPTNAAVLRLFDGVVIGSFPSSEWRKEQMDALVRYVEEGGAAVFLGGEESFGLGGYASTPLAALFPWQVGDREPDLMRGEFSVSVPSEARADPIVSGVGELLASEGNAVVESVNVAGPLKPGATALMHAGAGGRIVPLVAAQTFGKGRVMAIASNTQWKWARLSPESRKAYGLFWRQAVRSLAGEEEGGRVVSVKWDRDFYRPGEKGSARIRLAGGPRRNLHLSATLSLGEDSRLLPVEPVQEHPDEFVVRTVFPTRGVYLFRLAAQEGDKPLETYERSLPVAPLLGEGTRLEVDEKFLAGLAERTGGIFARENAIEPVLEHLTSRSLRKTLMSEASLVHGTPWFAVLFVMVLLAEWILRRRWNLL